MTPIKKIRFSFLGQTMAVLEWDGNKAFVVEAPEKCRAFYERLCKEGVQILQYPEYIERGLAKYHVEPNDPDFLRKIVPSIKAMWPVDVETADEGIDEATDEEFDEFMTRTFFERDE